MTDAERELVVDGEVFRVRLHDDGAFDCRWLSGPNPGYGFTAGASAGYTFRSGGGTRQPAPPRRQADDERVRDEIRAFLSMIDPATGFIGD